MANRRRIDIYYFTSKLGWELIPVIELSFYRSPDIIQLTFGITFIRYGMRVYFYLKDTWTDKYNEATNDPT